MKKLTIFLLAFSIALSLVACGNESEDPTPASDSTSTVAKSTAPDSSNPIATAETSHDPAPPNETLGEFNESGAIVETILVDESDVRITATELDYQYGYVDLALIIENNSDKSLSFVSGSRGYSCNSVNGYMVVDSYLNCEVEAGKKSNETISFSYDELLLYGITEIADMEIGFDISDDNYDHIYTGPRQISTTLVDEYDYNKDYYGETITSDAAMNTYGYSVEFFSTDTIYEQNDISIVSECLMVNKDGESSLMLEVVNNSSSPVNIATENISINGLTVYSSTFSYDTVNAGKHCIIFIALSSAFESAYWDVYGINEIGTVGLSISTEDEDANPISDSTEVIINSPTADVSLGVDESGTEVYNKDGISIISKGLIVPDPEYSEDIHVLLLAKNNSGKTITIDDVYDSLSANSFMTDYSFYSVELADGTYAVLDIELWESSLEDNNISDVSDITDIELRFEINEGWDTLDEAVVSISY